MQWEGGVISVRNNLFSVGKSVIGKARGKGKNNSKRKSFLGLTFEGHEGSRVPLRSSAFENSYFLNTINILLVDY